MHMQFRARANRSAEILIYEDIGEDYGGISAIRFADELKALGDVEKLYIRVNSGGGDVFEAMAMYHTLRRHSARKEVTIDGIALSAASYLILAGDHISMPRNARVMIHDPWTIAAGTSAALRKMAERLDDAREQILSIYVTRTAGDENKLRSMMEEETWMNGDIAHELGFVQEVTSDVAIAACFDRTRFRNTPKDLLPVTPISAHNALANARRKHMHSRKQQ